MGTTDHLVEQIVVGGSTTEDYMAWNYTRNGQFTVRAAYHLCMAQKRYQSGRLESYSPVIMHQGWLPLALWAASIPNKVKMHMWKILKNGCQLALSFFIGTSKQEFSVWHVGEKNQFCTAFGPVPTLFSSGRVCMR